MTLFGGIKGEWVGIGQELMKGMIMES